MCKSASRSSSILFICFPTLTLFRKKLCLLACLFTFPLFCSEADTVVEEAYQKLLQFDEELKWYEQYRQELSKDKNSSPYSLQTSNIDQHIQKAQELFLSFRGVVREVVFSLHGNHPYTQEILADQLYQVTEGYVHFMEQLLFPTDWQKRFAAYQTEKIGLQTQDKNQTGV